MGNVKQYYDIKFPFTANNLDGFFIDLNNRFKDKVLSEMLHVILTPKNSRLRMPEFGTDLIKYIFEPSDAGTWNSIKQEIKESVTKYVPKATLNDVSVLKNEDEDEHKLILKIDYSVKEGFTEENNIVAIEI